MTETAKPRAQRPEAIGPHEGRELELMLSGSKPLSMFVEPMPPEIECFPEERFDRFAAEGRLLKRERVESVVDADGETRQLRRILYAQPSEAWRIEAMLLVQDIYNSLLPGWRPDLERVIGTLLGYERADVEKFLASKRLL